MFHQDHTCAINIIIDNFKDDINKYIEYGKLQLFTGDNRFYYISTAYLRWFSSERTHVSVIVEMLSFSAMKRRYTPNYFNYVGLIT